MTANFPSKRFPLYANLVDTSGNPIGVTGNPFVTNGGAMGGNAAPNDVILGKTFTNDDGTQVGTLVPGTGYTEYQFNNMQLSGETTNELTLSFELYPVGGTYDIQVGGILRFTFSNDTPDPVTVICSNGDSYTFAGFTISEEFAGGFQCLHILGPGNAVIFRVIAYKTSDTTIDMRFMSAAGTLTLGSDALLLRYEHFN